MKFIVYAIKASICLGLPKPSITVRVKSPEKRYTHELFDGH